MRLLDIIAAPWAITPEMFVEVQGIYARHVRGEKINIKDVEARVGAPLQNQRPQVQVQDGVAVIPVEGVLAKRMNLLMQISGGASMQMLGNMVRDAAADSAVRGIILHVDSPGGTVDGTEELANIVAEAARQKPVIALADGAMASAAYWVGSAASKVFIAGETTAVGSIGIVATHVDVSGAEAKAGVKTTEITAGKYKRVASQYAPLSDEGRADIQAKVDYYYSVFVDAVAANRGVGVETALEKMADGRVFIGRQALAAGLVDGVATLDQLIARVAAGEFAAQSQAATGAGAAQAVNPKGEDMDIQKLKAEYPDLAAALVAEGREAGIREGAAAELQRIKDVEAQALPGHEALIAALKFDGKTTGEQAAAQVLAAERGQRAAKLDALREDGKAAASVPASGADPKAEAADPEASLPPDERAKVKWSRDAKLRADYGDNFEAYMAFERANAAGKVRVLTGKQAA